MWWLRRRSERHGEVLATFIVGYGVFRFLVEFLREPDQQVGFIAGWLTMGQILCLCMVAAGIGLFLYVRTTKAR
jgi:phosphatidylglycerol:prolipoprotein diacylglycerol transferase